VPLPAGLSGLRFLWLRKSNKTAGDCPDFAEQNGTVPLPLAVLLEFLIVFFVAIP